MSCQFAAESISTGRSFCPIGEVGNKGTVCLWILSVERWKTGIMENCRTEQLAEQPVLVMEYLTRVSANPQHNTRAQESTQHDAQFVLQHKFFPRDREHKVGVDGILRHKAQ